MTSQKIYIVGTEGTGKTVFLSVLAETLRRPGTFPFVSAKNRTTEDYVADILDQLTTGHWPKSTTVGIRKKLSWIWHDSQQNQHELHTSDCAGQDFRAIFEKEDDSELNEHQKELKEAFHRSHLVILLLNLQTAIELYGENGLLPGKNKARLDIAFAPAAALRRLRASGVSTCILFSQADRYETLIREKWGNNFDAAVKYYLPRVYEAIQETNSFYAPVSAFQTELRESDFGIEELLPKVGDNFGDLSNIIKYMDDFLVENAKKFIPPPYTPSPFVFSPESDYPPPYKPISPEYKPIPPAFDYPQKGKPEESDKKWFYLLIFLFCFIIVAFVTCSISRRSRLSSEGAEHAAFGPESNVPLPKGATLTLLPIAAGTFQMGSPESEEGRGSGETLHTVNISRLFWLGRYTVTQTQWKSLMGMEPSLSEENLPVTDISWVAAQEFCNKLTDQERAAKRLPAGYVYRLPTEAEWEYACRAGTKTPFSFGKVLNGETASCDGRYPYGTKKQGPNWREVRKVGSYSPNAWGLYDMHGNVWEWCWDWYGRYPIGAVTDPAGPATGDGHVIRGGDWQNSTPFCRSASRLDCNAHEFRRPCVAGLGFRVALAPEIKNNTP